MLIVIFLRLNKRVVDKSCTVVKFGKAAKLKYNCFCVVEYLSILTYEKYQYVFSSQFTQIRLVRMYERLCMLARPADHNSIKPPTRISPSLIHSHLRHQQLHTPTHETLAGISYHITTINGVFCFNVRIRPTTPKRTQHKTVSCRV